MSAREGRNGGAESSLRTKRLSVFRLPLQAGAIDKDFCLPRQLFVAFRTDEWRGPLVPASALICAGYPSAKHAVDSIEVSTKFRRKGIATELLDGLEVYLGDRLNFMGTHAELEASLSRARRQRGVEPRPPSDLNLLFAPKFSA